MTYFPYESAAQFDRRLGDPQDEGRAFSYARCAAHDEAETFPWEICRELDVLGLPGSYVPIAYGGTLRGYDEGLQLMRAVARRDLTVAIAHGKTFLGAVCVWTAGDREQALRLGTEIRDGAVVSWALTEREHGSDLLAGEVLAEPTPDGYRLTGEKWLINNATRGHLACVLARTSQAGGARGFSVLLVDKRALAPGEFRPLPAVRLHGIRGADISGMAFTGAEVPASALVGRAGDGLATVVKSLQLTRTLCTSLSLGAGDQALAMAVQYAGEQHNHGRLLIDLPQTRRLVTESYADLLLAEAVALVAGRGIHALTGELAVLSATTKYFVPSIVERLIGRLAKVMGSRSQLVGPAYGHGRFQKVQRDHRIVGIFDGSTVVNLHALIVQLPALARGYREGLVDQDGLRSAVTLHDELPEFDRDRLALLSRTGCSPVQVLPAATDELLALAAAGEVPESLGWLAAQWRAVTDELHERLNEYQPIAVDIPAEAFTLAERYAGCFAASAAIHLWLRNRSTVDDPVTAELWRSGLWLEAALTGLLRQVAPDRSVGQVAADDVYERLATVLLAQHKSGRLLSLLPYPSSEDGR